MSRIVYGRCFRFFDDVFCLDTKNIRSITKKMLKPFEPMIREIVHIGYIYRAILHLCIFSKTKTAYVFDS